MCSLNNYLIQKSLFSWIVLCLLLGCANKKELQSHNEIREQKIEHAEGILDFYSTKDPYGEFSNFALFQIFIDGEWWMTSEHYYQAHKYIEPDLIAWVKSAESPMEAALRGRDPKIPKRSDWNDVKDLVMEKAVRAKFASYPELQVLLLSTGDLRLYEHTKNDCYWGDCGDRTGKNKLGILLEKIRAELRKAKQ